MDKTRPRRIYIRRKRCLQETQKTIFDVLCSIALSQGKEINEEELNKEALEYANTIEASCWSPHLKISDEDFQAITKTKTQDLCQILLKRSLNPIAIKAADSTAQEPNKTKLDDIQAIQQIPIISQTPPPSEGDNHYVPPNPQFSCAPLFTLSGYPQTFLFSPVKQPMVQIQPETKFSGTPNINSLLVSPLPILKPDQKSFNFQSLIPKGTPPTQLFQSY